MKKIIIRLARVLSFPLGLLLTAPGLLLWVITERNLGIELLEYSIIGEYPNK